MPILETCAIPVGATLIPKLTPDTNEQGKQLLPCSNKVVYLQQVTQKHNSVIMTASQAVTLAPNKWAVKAELELLLASQITIRHLSNTIQFIYSSPPRVFCFVVKAIAE